MDEQIDHEQFMEKTESTVGSLLAAERRGHALTLAEIAESTCIRERMLQALEDDAFDHLPSTAYVKGYIQSYAAVMGVSAEPFLTAYKQQLLEPIADSPRKNAPLSVAAYAEAVVPKKDHVHAIPQGLLLIITVVLAGILIVWVLVGLFKGGDETSTLPPDTSIESTSTIEDVGDSETGPGITPEQLDAPVITNDPANATEGFVVGVAVESFGASWIRATIDGEVLFEGTLAGSETSQWEAIQTAEIRIGNPAFVTVTRDGEPVPIPEGQETPTVQLVAQ